MKERSPEGIPDSASGDAGVNPEICIWCRNRMQDVCPPCQEEGKYRWLEPETLADWELPPELPPMRKLVDCPAADRLAIIWLNASYRQMREGL